jgi:ABC-type lipoprotein release transport system permease subunit
MIVKALEDEGFSAFEVPFVQFAVIGVLAVIAGVIASGRPAWRAANLNILEAIAME